MTNGVRGLAVAAALALAAVAIAWLTLGGEASAAAPSTGAATPAIDAPAPTDVAAAVPAIVDDAAPTMGPAPMPSQRAADTSAATAVVEIVAAEDGRPIEGAALQRLPAGKLSGRTDASGRCTVAPSVALVVAAPDRLLRTCAVSPQATGERPQRVELLADRWSRRVQFEFGTGPAQPGEPVMVRLLPGGPLADPPELARASHADVAAWREHVALGVLPALASMHLHLGEVDAATVFRLASGDVVRLAKGGDFRVEAATASGLVGAATRPLRDRDNGVLRLDLVPGRYALGVVVDERDAPVVGAVVAVRGGDPLALAVRTGDGGAFRFGPLGPAVVAATVHGAGFEVADVPLGAVVDDVRVRLVRSGAGELLVHVRDRATGTPIVGASVWTLTAALRPQEASTDEAGDCRLAIATDGPVRVRVRARGSADFEQVVDRTGIDPASPRLDVDLWPGSRAARVAAGLTGSIEGLVVDADGRPVAGESVVFRPASVGAAPADHGAPYLPLLVRSAADGSFAVEMRISTAGLLTLAAGNATEVATAIEVGSIRRNAKLVRR